MKVIELRLARLERASRSAPWPGAPRRGLIERNTRRGPGASVRLTDPERRATDQARWSLVTQQIQSTKP